MVTLSFVARTSHTGPILLKLSLGEQSFEAKQNSLWSDTSMATEVVVFRKWINTGTTITLFSELPADIHDRYCRNSPMSLGHLWFQSMRSSRQSEASSKTVAFVGGWAGDCTTDTPKLLDPPVPRQGLWHVEAEKVAGDCFRLSGQRLQPVPR
jgi:hypothetical protein